MGRHVYLKIEWFVTIIAAIMWGGSCWSNHAAVWTLFSGGKLIMSWGMVFSAYFVLFGSLFLFITCTVIPISLLLVHKVVYGKERNFIITCIVFSTILVLACACNIFAVDAGVSCAFILVFSTALHPSVVLNGSYVLFGAGFLFAVGALILS